MKRLTLILLLLWAFSWGCSLEEQDRNAVFYQEKSAEEWIEMLADENGWNRTAATLALEDMGSDAVPQLLKAFHRKDTPGRHKILNILYQLGPEAKEAVSTLDTLIEDGNEAECDRFLALRTLQRMGAGAKASIPSLVGLIQDENEPE